MKTVSAEPICKLKGLLLIGIILSFNLITYSSFAQHVNWVVSKEGQGLKNPLAHSIGVAEGKALYATNCSPCHGDKGKGDGPASQALNPKPADHTSALIQAETDGSLFWKLSEGRSPMPGYKQVFSEKQRWQVVNYIRTLAKK